jgi:hypothetical protein
MSVVTEHKNAPSAAITDKVRDSVESTLAKISEADNPGPLVKALPPHDFLVAWRAADDEQRADLMRLADQEQVDLLVDLSCWLADFPDLDELEALIKPLAFSGLGGAIRVLDALQPELKTLFLKRNARIHLLENRNDEVPVDEGSEVIACPDGFYFIEFPEPQNVTDVERTLWGALLSQPFEAYQLELECIRHDLPSELTENALRWRTGRLADWGFVAKGEAVALLAPRSARDVRLLADKADVKLHPLSSIIQFPQLYKENYTGNEFLDRVIRLMEASDDETVLNRLDTVGAELTLMTGTFLTAISTDLKDIDAVARGVRWARDLWALGLYETAEGNIETGARQFVALAPGFFLQVGLGLTYPLARRAKALLADKRLGGRGAVGAIFDPPHRVTLSCLARDIPCRWPPLRKGGNLTSEHLEPFPGELAAFSSRDEIDYWEKLLSEAENLPALLFDRLECEAPPPEETPASMLVLTALANAASGREPKPTPLSYKDAVSFKERLVEQSLEKFAGDALAALAMISGVAPKGPLSPIDEADPSRRLLLRLIIVGRARLMESAPEHALLIEPA